MGIWNFIMEGIIKSILPLSAKIWAFNHLKGNPLKVKGKDHLRELIHIL